MLTIEDAKARVKLGAAWLDERYPNWWDKIDLGTLELSSCDLCVLGQVWTGVVPVEEKFQLIAQAVKGSCYTAKQAMAGDGFNLMMWSDGDLYLYNHVQDLGFDLKGVNPNLEPEKYETLTQAWTDLIISRRLAAHPETLKAIEDLLADLSTGVGREWARAASISGVV